MKDALQPPFVRHWVSIAALSIIMFAPCLPAQTAASATAKGSAPIDLTGYWVSIITEDWRWRMVTPPKGDYASIPISAEGRMAADKWDPDKDEAAGEQCRSYGAAGIMRIPGRLHISWADDDTLKVETDAGMQTRLFHFANWKAPQQSATWQGDSVASWQTPSRGRGQARVASAGSAANSGSLKVVTNHMRPGYLRKNGVPYGADALMTEYWDLYKEPDGPQWIVITTLIDDPVNLRAQYVTSPNFRREPNDSKWDPSPCSAAW
jgi:hypothetical protein